MAVPYETNEDLFNNNIASAVAVNVKTSFIFY